MVNKALTAALAVLRDRTADPMEWLQVDGICKSFGGRTVVGDVRFTISRGETVAFLGPNGAGKSTAVRMMAGFLEPEAGDVRILGLSITTERRAAQAKLGYLAEGAPLLPDLSVAAFLGYLARMHGLKAEAARGAIDRVCELADLDPVRARVIGGLSKGYRRRVALAGAMIHNPPVLLLDEPTDGLDPNQKAAMRQWIEVIRPDRAILISTHQLDEVEAMCTRAVVIAAGRIVADDRPAALSALVPTRRLEDAFQLLTGAASAATSPAGPA